MVKLYQSFVDAEKDATPAAAPPLESSDARRAGAVASGLSATPGGAVSEAEYEELCDALVSAFPSKTDLKMMLQFRLGRHLDSLAQDAKLPAMVFELIGEANAGGWTASLVAAARESRPGNPALLAFSERYGVGPRAVLPQGKSYELFLNESNSYLDPAGFRAKLGEIEGQVCCVELPSGASGTGFLVGPDLVLTNHHVIAPILGKDDVARRVVLRFDYKALAGGKAVSDGREYRLHPSNWLLDASPESPVDLEPLPKKGTVDPDHLDYALLRCAGSPGTDPVGARPEPGAPPRLWVDCRARTPSLGGALFIVQHPRGAALKIALETKAISGVNENATRVRYRTNTEPGSSGSPCFDQDWNLIAVHHAGDPAYYRSLPATYNEGIPIGAIVERLRRRGIELAAPPRREPAA